jgi:hypothetical protein
MNTQQDDALEQWLKADAAKWRDQYIDDDGFTQRVMGNLAGNVAARPSMVTSNPYVTPTMRFALTYGLAIVAAIIVTFFAGGANFAIDALMDVATSTMTTTVLGFGAMLLVATVGCALALVQQR